MNELNLTSIFSRTLVVGASVSDAALDRNPSKLFLQRLGGLASAVTHARDGATGAKMLSTLSKSALNDRTAVLAIDLLFWDSVIGWGDPREAKAFLRGFLNELRTRRVPLVIGRIPGFHPMQVHRDELNTFIEKEIDRSKLTGHPAIVLELDKVFDDVKRDDGLMIDGRHHALKDLIPDGLHPGPIAARFIAQRIFECALHLATS